MDFHKKNDAEKALQKMIVQSFLSFLKMLMYKFKKKTKSQG